jgi:drug/metabolite transporter (DMT)-like permease
VFGALVLGEAMDVWTVAAICLIAAGLWLATRGSPGGAGR